MKHCAFFSILIFVYPAIVIASMPLWSIEGASVKEKESIDLALESLPYLKYTPLNIAVVDPEEFATAVGFSNNFYKAWTIRRDSKIYLSRPLASGISLKYMLTHEVFHLISPYTGERWIEEGLAELFAFVNLKVSPVLSIQSFLSIKEPISFFENDPRNFSIANYGQSFLFFYYLYKKQLIPEPISFELPPRDIPFLYADFLKDLFLGQYPMIFSNLYMNHSWEGPLESFSFSVVDMTDQYFLGQKLQVLDSDKNILKLILVETKDKSRHLIDLKNGFKIKYNDIRKLFVIHINPTANSSFYRISFED